MAWLVVVVAGTAGHPMGSDGAVSRGLVVGEHADAGALGSAMGDAVPPRADRGGSGGIAQRGAVALPLSAGPLSRKAAGNRTSVQIGVD